MLENIKVIDTHCHLFDTQYKKRKLDQTITMSLEKWDNNSLKETLIYKRIMKAYRELFNNNKMTEEEILSLREENMKEDYEGFLKLLFNKVNLEKMIVDIGYKPENISLEKFEEIVPVEIYYVFRIETILDRIWGENIDFDEAEKIFDKEIEDAIQSGIVALKSIIGYRTGLKVNTVSRKEAKNALTEKRNEKKFRDYFFIKTINVCIEHNLTFQIHAAFGESNISTLNNNPMFLKDIIDEYKDKEVKFVLVHGGYPYCFEASYLAGVYPNVYLDFSETIPFLMYGGKEIIRKHLDMAPFTKIMFGTDGFTIPDISWFGVVEGKKVLGKVLKDLNEKRILTKTEAKEVGEKILYKNALKVFKLK